MKFGVSSIISLFFLSLLILVIRQAYLYATDSPYRISSAEAKRRIQRGEVDVILDVRTDLERATLGVYPGSIHIQSADLEARMPARVPDKKARILAYCNTGHRARMATDKLHALGYTNAVYISSTHTSLH
jgi:rhodanese-related sulfurtransferase